MAETERVEALVWSAMASETPAWSFSFRVEGEATPKPRPRARVLRPGGPAMIYSPKAKGDWERKVRVACSVRVPLAKPWPGPVAVTIWISHAPPPSWPRWRQEAAIGRPCIDRGRDGGDIDNVAKVFLDAMTGMVYEDDQQVWSLSVVRRRTETSWALVSCEGFPGLPVTRKEQQKRENE